MRTDLDTSAHEWPTPYPGRTASDSGRFWRTAAAALVPGGVALSAIAVALLHGEHVKSGSAELTDYSTVEVLILVMLLSGIGAATWALRRLLRLQAHTKYCETAQARMTRNLQARLNGILDGADEAFWDWRIDTDNRWFSSRIYDLLGIGGDTIWHDETGLCERMHPDDRAGFDAELKRRLQSRQLSAVEYRLRTERGEYRWFRDRGCVVEWSDEQAPMRMCGSLTDITTERRARRELEMNRELLQRAEAIARVGGWRWIFDGDRLFWTEQVFRIYELPMTYRLELGAAMACYEPQSRAQLEAAFEATRRDGTPIDLELAFRTVKGRPLWVRVIGEPDFDGEQIIGLHGTFQDISERKRFELALKESEQRYKLAVESAADGIWDWNLNADQMVHNETWAMMLGHAPAQTTTRFEQWMELMHPEDMPRVRAVLQAYLDNKTPRFESRHRMKTESGEWKWILTRGKVVACDSDGRPARMAGTHKDVSFDKEVEDQLRAAHQAAEAATRSKTEFLANMSHEIRTPMTAILGFSESLLNDDINEAERIRSINTIRRNGEHLLHIINDILDLSKIEAGRLTMETIFCSPLKIAYETTELLRVRAEAKQLDLALEISGRVPSMIESDPTRLRQILVNIIGNAIKFTETGGVRVIVGFRESESGTMVAIDVIDTGIGMTAKETSRLFRPFSQADTTTTRQFGGTGLGLVISRRLAELMGGTITVESGRHRGSRFTVSVPAGNIEHVPFVDSLTEIQQEAELGETAHAERRGEMLSARVLVAEDGPDNQRLITMMLQKAGATAIIADNGREAIRMINARRAAGSSYDVVLMDMQMPVLDGYEATRQLRAQGYTGPIVALTAHTMRGDREKCIAAGCTDYLTKPIDRQKLIESIRRHTRPESPSAITG